MFRSVIIATDLSSAAFAVVNNMSSLKRFGIEECLLVHCVSAAEADSSAVSDVTSEKEMDLHAQKKILEDQGFTAEMQVVSGSAANEINRIAEEGNYSLIIVGAEARNIISEPLLGGIAYEIIHYCRKPTLLVRLDEIRENGVLRVLPVRNRYNGHILFPTDFSANADQAFEVLKQLVSYGVSKVTLMHVQDQTRLNPYLLHRLSQFNEIDEERLSEMEKALRQIAGLEIEKAITYGNPSRDILKAVEERDVQLVVMGSQGRGFVRDLFLGSVGHNLARQSAASVLLVPMKETGIPGV